MFGCFRYFLVFCFYASLGSGLGVWNIFEVMTHHRNALSHELAYYLLPFTTAMYLMGSAKAWEVAYVALMDFGVGALTATLFFFCHSLYKVTGSFICRSLLYLCLLIIDEYSAL